MKSTKYIPCLLLITILSIISCSKSTDTGLLSRLSDIQAMGDSCPLKAILRLDSIKPLFEEESEYARNKMSLPDIRLRDKAFIAHNSDSTMKAVCRFFENQGSARDKQEAYYYMGSVYRDLNDYPNAVTYFLKSIKLAEDKTVIDNALLENACSQLSHLYHMQFNYAEALDVALKGLHIAEKSRTADERTYMGVASSYYEINDMLNCLLFCNKAISIIENKGIKKENADIVSRAMSLYAAAGCHEDSKKCLNLLNSLKENERPRNYLASLSKYCAKYVSKDSAAIIVERIFEKTGNIQELYDVSKWLTGYYSNKGDYENATKYAMYFIRVNNAFIDNRKFEHTTKAKNIFRYQRDKEEELRIIEQGRKDRYYLILGISVSLILLLAAAVIYYRRKKMLLEIILNKENDIKETSKEDEEEPFEIVAPYDLTGEATYNDDGTYGVKLEWVIPYCVYDHFNIYRRVAGGTYEKIAETESLTYYDDVNADGTYYYQVTSFAEVDGVEYESEPATAADGSGQNFVEITLTSIEENGVQGLTIYPNPTKNNINITAENMTRITVTNALGQVMYDQEVVSDNEIINMAQYEAGVYMVRIVTENGVAVERITVVR